MIPRRILLLRWERSFGTSDLQATELGMRNGPESSRTSQCTDGAMNADIRRRRSSPKSSTTFVWSLKQEEKKKRESEEMLEAIR